MYLMDISLRVAAGNLTSRKNTRLLLCRSLYKYSHSIPLLVLTRV
jgi:hypothetical protein